MSRRREAQAVALAVASMAATGVFLTTFPADGLDITGVHYGLQVVAFILLAAAGVRASTLESASGAGTGTGTGIGADRLRRVAYALVWLAAVCFLLASFTTCTPPSGD